MCGHVFLQDDRSLERLVAHCALEQLVFRRVNVLPMRSHPFLAVELLITHITVIPFVCAFMAQHMVLQGVSILITPSTDLAL